MNDVNRRKFLEGSAGMVAGASAVGGSTLLGAPALAQSLAFKPLQITTMVPILKLRA